MRFTDWFEWKGAPALSAKLWLFLGVAIAAPFPAFGWQIPERGVPIMWLLVCGALVACAVIARTSTPFAALIIWMIVRAAYHSFPDRSLKVTVLILMVGLLYAAARDVPDQTARTVAWAFLLGAGWEALLGTVNAFGVYPWMNWVDPAHVGKPMGFLTHPNYWGSYMALMIPVIWALLGIPAALVAYALILKTVSVGPVLSASAGLLVMAWPLFGRRVRYGLIAGLTAASVTILNLHEWRLSGRREVWEAALPEVARWPILGQGIGQWRVWANDYNAAKGSFWATLQAHNEPLQLAFELGLIGLVLGGLWLLQAGLAARVVWKASPAAILPGPVWQFGRAPLERAWIAVVAVACVNSLGSPVFHLPGQAALILFALARVQSDAAALAEPARDDLGAAEPEARPITTKKRRATCRVP